MIKTLTSRLRSLWDRLIGDDDEIEVTAKVFIPRLWLDGHTDWEVWHTQRADLDVLTFKKGDKSYEALFLPGDLLEVQSDYNSRAWELWKIEQGLR